VRLLTQRQTLSVAVPIYAPQQRAPIFVLLPLLLLAPTLGAIAVWRFDGLYGQDAFAYYDYALGPLRQALIERTSLPPFFWPPGYPLLVAAASFVFGLAAGQVVSVLMGGLVPLFTALLARALWPNERWLPLVAGTLVALSGQLWQSSIVVMADTTGLAMATLSCWAVARYARRPHLGWLLLASLAIVVALLSRWIYALVAVPLAVYVVSLRAPPRHILVAAALTVTLLLPILGAPLLQLFREPESPAAFAGNLQVYSWAPANALRSEFDTPDGRLSYAQPNGLYYAAAPANLALFGPLLAPWIIVGLLVALRTWSARTLLLILGWAALVFAFHAGAPWQNFRFTLAYVPPLAIVLAFGLSWVGWWWSPRLIAIWFALGLTVMVFGGVRLLNGFAERQQEERALVTWVESEVTGGARLLTFGPTLTFTHFSRVPTFDLFEVTDTELGRAAPTYVLVDVANIELQWSDKRPGELYRRLRDGPGLELLGTRGAMTLFRVEPT
jgi:hypothetical protein